MKTAPALTQIGAIAGLFYGVSKQKPFWTTAGLTLLFAVGGTVLGMTYDSIKKN
jgi:hypothetical protein